MCGSKEGALARGAGLAGAEGYARLAAAEPWEQHRAVPVLTGI